MNKIPRRIWLAIVMIAIGIAPMISVASAMFIARLAGCEMNESDVPSCVVMGADIGGLVYAMAMMGWLMLISVFFLGAGLLWLALEGVALIVRRVWRG